MRSRLLLVAQGTELGNLASSSHRANLFCSYTNGCRQGKDAPQLRRRNPRDFFRAIWIAPFSGATNEPAAVCGPSTGPSHLPPRNRGPENTPSRPATTYPCSRRKRAYGTKNMRVQTTIHLGANIGGLPCVDPRIRQRFHDGLAVPEGVEPPTFGLGSRKLYRC
jgi:hypothetical protein